MFATLSELTILVNPKMFLLIQFTNISDVKRTAWLCTDGLKRIQNPGPDVIPGIYDERMGTERFVSGAKMF